ncbi:MAG: hypothetical protein ABTS16_14965 [Candidatus Accumulibacter phosphatis]|uniref:DUF1570 domain-containing protein n=1 Tax=Candidatus Accumulibacter contiguus TaxID=2954381 RepID=A0ABX1T5C8_9PROT|nr:hypothetical protein [Candidatus Accumulibacter contiguus]NMQ04839.1 hypothetical protein [Candidatus Accumulibacter contiguus]
MKSGFDTIAGRIRKMIGTSVLMAMTQSAWALDAVQADFSQVFDSRTGELTVWQMAENPSIYIFDFPGLTYQGRSFNRITQFTEQQTTEPYPKVLSNQELARYVEAARRTQADFAFGHDVLISELVQFFNFALRDKVELNPEEIVIREFLMEQGLVRFWRGFYQAMKPGVVVLAIPQTQDRKATEPMVSPGARYAILLHELAHGEYYANPHYAKFCQRFWYETMTENQRELFKRFLANFNYAVNNEELLINEMQAYLMFTPDPKSFSARKLGVSDAELQSLRETFRRGSPPIRLPMR